jgi:hydrogenase/urease accessory protein HupE
LLWASCPSPASAHLVNSGFGPFYDGISHLLVTPEDLLVVVAISLLAGLGGKQYGRSVLFLLPLAWLAGAAAGRMTPFTAGMPILSALLLIALGALVVLPWDRRLSVRFIAGFALVVGLVHGLCNGAALAGANSGSLAIAGIGCAVFVVTALVAGQVVSLQREWARHIVRVAGSWIGAIGLLMLGWATR